MNIRYLKGVGPTRCKQLQNLGIETVGDLLLHVPREYLDRRFLTPVAQLVPGADATVSGRIASSGFWKTRRGKTVFQAVLEDDSGRMKLSFFNWKYVSSRLDPGIEITASGSVDPFDGASMVHPDIEFINPDIGFISKVLPVYPLTSGISQNYIRKLAETALEQYCEDMADILPQDYLQSQGWESRSQVIRSVHFPNDPEEGEKARRILALEELFLHQLILRSVRESVSRTSGIEMNPSGCLLAGFTESLQFELTSAQKRSITGIGQLMSSSNPMRMLLQGDVGSGKTVVAAAASVICCGSGYQSVFVAPTEVLAAQHFRTLKKMLGPLGYVSELLTGGTSRADRVSILESLSNGSIDVLIGTHAVLEDSVRFSRLGLCVIDEQHKFGVQQREILLSERHPVPHLLIMSATPIPRTLAMTLYGDLNSSIIDEMPPHRGRITTRVMDRERRNDVFDHLRHRLEFGERAYIVYPLREASEETDLGDATTAYSVLREGSLAQFGIGMLTGAMKACDKIRVTDSFIAGDISILVSTTVIEVGIDVPEATVMIVANADRFGLSQLHQLRGRIGRGGSDSWCYLMKGSSCGSEAARRLSVLESTDDGFEIARADLQLRGPGEIAGTRQHGLPMFRIASLVSDQDLLEIAVELSKDEDLNTTVREEIQWRFPGFKLSRKG